MKNKKRQAEGIRRELHRTVKFLTESLEQETPRSLRVRATNEWMRRYIEEPERFNREWDTVALFRAEENAGTEPSYGERCESYLEQLMAELLEQDRKAAA